MKTAAVKAWWTPCLIAGVAVVLVLTAGLFGPATPQSQQPTTVQVSETTVACPLQVAPTSMGFGEVFAHPGAELSAFKLGAKPAPSGSGPETIGGLQKPGGWVTHVVAGSPEAIGLRYYDEAGAGFVAFAGGRAKKSAGGGLGITQCSGARPQMWFLGAGSSTRHRSALLLTNLGTTPAVADIAMFGLEGPVEVVDGEGIVVDPQTAKTIQLEGLAAGEHELAVRVTSRRGVLAVSLHDSSTAGFQGSEWIPATHSPARELIVTGLPRTVSGDPNASSDRDLLIVNPSDATAMVTIEVLGDKGAIVAADFKEVKVAAGRLKLFPIPGSVGSDPVSLRLHSTERISASVRSTKGDTDFGYSVAGQGVSGPAIVPIKVGKALNGLHKTILLTAAGESTNVKIAAFDAAMAPMGSHSVKLEADRTRRVALTKDGLFAEPIDKISYVVVTAAKPVWATSVYADESALTIVPLREAPLRVLAPDVHPLH